MIRNQDENQGIQKSRGKNKIKGKKKQNKIQKSR